MPRENSVSDEADGRSLTPDLDEEHAPRSPTYSNSPEPPNGIRKRTSFPKATSPLSPTDSRQLPERLDPGPTASLSPGDRFRVTVRKVMQMHRTTSLFTSRGVGAEPGIDPRRDSANLAYGHIRENCVIEVCDYSGVRSSFGRMTNREFVDFMNNSDASAKEPWVKVRWINICGISWDVISAVAVRYDLHPLAVEDVLHTTAQKRSKADYYTKHLFLRILCHSIARDGEVTLLSEPVFRHTVTELPRSTSPDPFNEKDYKGIDTVAGEGEEREMYGSSTLTPRKGLTKLFWRDLEKGSSDKPKMPPLRFRQNTAREEQVKEEISIDALKTGDRVHVKVEPMFIFLTRGGTVISLHPKKNHNFLSPITARLRQTDTLLRTSADPSLLVQSLLDLIVDQALEVVDEYQSKILKFEHDILLTPKMKTVRNLHILSGDLILHKRTLEPIKTLIYGLRRYDVDRCAALLDQSKVTDNTKIEGFMSHKAKIYLADVFDHTEHILASLDMFSSVAENLISFSFNMASYDMNEVMRRLTLATIIFLPLTLLTGYFGMNFTYMWTIHEHSDVIFWIISLPIMAIILPIFLQVDILRMVHYVKKRIAARNAVKTYKQA